MSIVKMPGAMLLLGFLALILVAGCATKKGALVEEEQVTEEKAVSAKPEAAPDVAEAGAPEVKKEAVEEDMEEEVGAVEESKEESEVTVVAKAEEEAFADSDGDGVPDDYDRCPGTAPGSRVDRYGCPEVVKRRVTFEYTLVFDSDSSAIRSFYYEERQRAIDFMVLHPEMVIEKVVIEGHADSTGSSSYNDTLSHRRALSVKQFIVKELGVSPGVIEINAYGEKKPIASNKTKEGRQKNRRVVVTFIVSNLEGK